MNPKIPSSKIVREYLKKWDNLENYVAQESSLTKLFASTYRTNTHLDDVLIKVCSLNDFYSTNILNPFRVAKHIVSLKIDNDLAAEDLEIVNKIALIRMNETKTVNFYSFASKYCSHHRPKVFPIYDSFVERMLMHFKRQDDFALFKKGDLRDYPKYRHIIVQFRSFYGLDQFDLKQIDKYLWQAGKEHFPRRY